MPMFIGLPHGVSLPRNLAEPDARHLVTVLARTYQWTGPLFGRAEVAAYLHDQQDHPDNPSTLTLTDADWQRIRQTAAWRNLASTARRAVTAADTIGQALRQAGLRCAECDSPVTGPPTATWGLCPVCLNSADLADLQRRPCPAGDGETSHSWGDNACTNCSMPAPVSRPHLAAVVTAA
ncbi:hypothetical protein ACN268_11240 [Micromonospora sp. WMMD735]|uniref:hypothetical protein n=1 Tax=Micromonospora sp. WMMD735 TaxID=3404130 RepID=UPI003B94EC47